MLDGIEDIKITNLLANCNWNRLSFSSEDELGLTGIKEVQLLRVATHGSVILLNKEPTDFILGNVRLLLTRSGIRRSGSLGGLKAGAVDNTMSVIRIRICRVVAVHGSLRRIGHGGRKFCAVRKGKEKSLSN